MYCPLEFTPVGQGNYPSDYYPPGQLPPRTITPVGQLPLKAVTPFARTATPKDNNLNSNVIGQNFNCTVSTDREWGHVF